MSDKMLIQHCSPTLAGLKTGSMFCCDFTDYEELKHSIRRLNRMLCKKGLRVLPLRCRNNRALIYVFRPMQLRRDLHHATASELLSTRGYLPHAPERCIVQLIQKLKESAEFPHEIGLFLGYPPEDVHGFIENKADCCKCVGCWKVYGDAEKAQKLFEKYRKCTTVYTKHWSQGKALERLVVSTPL